MARSVIATFRELLRQALNTAMRADKQTWPHLNKLTRYIAANNAEASVDAMLDVYYADHEKLEAQGGADAGYISAGVFEQLAILRIEAAPFFDPWLQQAFKLLSKLPPAAEPDDLFRKRFDRLDAITASKIRAHLNDRYKAKRNSLTFFEILMDLRLQKVGALPEDEQQLLSFAPMDDAALLKEYRVTVGQVLIAALRHDPAGAEKALMAFASWCSQTKDVARAFQILLWSRTAVINNRAKPHSLAVWVFNEIYMVSIQRTLICAIDSGYLAVQTGFLGEAEVDLLIQPLVVSTYFSDYADRLYSLSENGALSGGSRFTDLASLHLRLLIFTEAKNIYLLSAEKRDEVADIIMAEGPALKKDEVRLSGSLAQLARTARAGDRITDRATLVYVPGGLNLVVALDGFEHQLFEVSETTAGKWLDQYFMDELIRGTQHLLVLIPAFFELLQYTATFITGGFLALLEEYVENKIADALSDVAYEITGSEELQMVVSAVGSPSTLALPSRALAKTAGKAGVKGVRKVKAAWKARKGTIPKAKVVLRKKGPKTKKAKPPKAKKSKKFSKAEQKRILKTDAELRALEKKKVKLGKPDGTGAFTEISGADAIAMLFRDKIADIPRLKQHWPIDLQKKYLKELRDAIEQGIKDPKLRKQVLDSVDMNVLNKAVLDLLPAKLQEKLRGIVKRNWDGIRKAFWSRVKADKALREELASIGIKFGGSSRGSAPDLDLAGIRIKCSLDHVKRKVENPLEAFSADNLRILTGRDNSVLKEGIVRNIRDTTGLNLDDYSASPNFGRDSIPQAYKDELARILKESPEEGDIWRSFEDPESPKL